MGWVIFKACIALLITVIFNNEQHNKKDIRNSPQYWFQERDSLIIDNFNVWQISKKRTSM